MPRHSCKSASPAALNCGAAFVTTLGALTFMACVDVTIPSPGPGGGGGGTVVVTQNQDSQNAGPSARPTPGGSGLIYKVKVGFFGGDCPSGPLPAGQTLLEVGCNGDMTATPKILNADGGTDRDATEVEHGPDDEVIWTAAAGAEVLACVTSPANGFNRICSAKRRGAWQQCASVKGVRGCAEGTVQ